MRLIFVTIITLASARTCYANGETVFLRSMTIFKQCDSNPGAENNQVSLFITAHAMALGSRPNSLAQDCFFF